MDYASKTNSTLFSHAQPILEHAELLARNGKSLEV
jgi:hypothetical protein